MGAGTLLVAEHIALLDDMGIDGSRGERLGGGSEFVQNLLESRLELV